VTIQDSGVVIDALFVPTLTTELVDRLKRGGVTTVHHTVAIFESFRGLVDRVLDLEDALRRLHGGAAIVRSVEEIEAAHAAGRIGVVLGVQSPSVIEDDERLVGPMHALGVRVFQMTYNHRNLLADGCAEESDAGLSALGRRVVARLNKAGVLIDLSHAGERSAHETIDLSAKPIAITHSNAQALCDHPRNLSDETIRAVAARGGVIGLNAFPGFVTKDHTKVPTPDDLVDHLAHMSALVGPQHFGFGLDIDEPDTPHANYLTPDGELGVGRHPFPPGFLPPWPWHYAVPSIADYPRLVEALVRRGFSDDEVKGFIGGNFMRLFRECW
jgi:membrane dipeptidase